MIISKYKFYIYIICIKFYNDTKFVEIKFVFQKLCVAGKHERKCEIQRQVAIFFVKEVSKWRPSVIGVNLSLQNGDMKHDE